MRSESHRLPRPRRRAISSFLLPVVLTLLAIPLLFPLWWLVTSSFKGVDEIFAYPPRLLPESFDLTNFGRVFELQPFARQALNSLYIAAVNVIGTLVFSSLAGYAFARVRFRGRDVLFVLMLSALLIPLEVLMIPLYALMGWLGWLGTHLPLLVLPVLGVDAVIGTFLMRQYFLSLPVELEDAGRIDGLGRFGIFRRIALPLARPALATVAVLTFLTSWSAFLEPIIFVSGVPELLTVPAAIPLFADSYGFPVWEVQMAASTLSIIPILVVFLVAKRFIIQGFARTGIHG
jgi:multiple sugar transport system permease protein